VARKKLTPAEHARRGTFQPSRHGESARSLGIDEADPTTWFRHHSPHAQALWSRYLAKYIPGNRLACYPFIAWLAAVEATEYWRQKRGDPPQAAAVRTYEAGKLADLFKRTQWRRRR
jgi:hypothetical protein